MQHLTTDDNGIVRFAVISHTAFGSLAQRPVELDWFYRALPRLGVTTVLNLGDIADSNHNQNHSPRLFPLSLPQVDGVSTLDASPLGVVSGALVAQNNPPVGYRQNVFPLIHGRSRSAATLFVFNGIFPGDSLARRVAEREASRQDNPASEVVLIGGHHQADGRWYCHGRCYMASVGVFAARRSFRRAPRPFGGSIVEVKLNPEGVLENCTVTFRDMSGGMPDFKPGDRYRR
jgi:hypothetical protein